MYKPPLAARLLFSMLLCAVNAGAQEAGARSQATRHCAGVAPGSALKELLETEYAFEREAQLSVRGAFLAYLGEDSLVLEPGPTPARAFYEASKPSDIKLQWYPTIAVSAGDGDLGFSTGPWVYSAAPGTVYHGDFITIWKRDASCQWRVQFDGGVSHAATEAPGSKLLPDQAASIQMPAAPARRIAQDAPGETVRHFERIAQQDGLAPGIRTYARNGDFRFYADGEAPKNADAAAQFLAARPVVTSWSEAGHGRSDDSSLLYSVGRFTSKQGGQHAYLQIWQYDPKVANWGLRILLITKLA